MAMAMSSVRFLDFFVVQATRHARFFIVPKSLTVHSFSEAFSGEGDKKTEKLRMCEEDLSASHAEYWFPTLICLFFPFPAFRSPPTTARARGASGRARCWIPARCHPGRTPLS